MASGEMSRSEFETFLATYLERVSENMQDGAIGFHCMDFRSIALLIGAGEKVFGELKQLIVWRKDNAGMSAFYRAQHELIACFKKGSAPHVNNFGLGAIRYRTNVWDYAGANTFRKGRDEDLAAHPTVKPVAMVMDAIKDVSRPGEIVLDPFGGSGSTMQAAERTHRQARLIELDPLYVDVAVKRWQKLTGKSAVLESDGRSFAEIADARTVGVGQ